MTRPFTLTLLLAMLMLVGSAGADRPRTAFQSQPATLTSGGVEQSFQFTLTAEQALGPQALCVRGPIPGEGWGVSVDGADLTQDPVVVGEESWYQIAADLLREGSNSVTIASDGAIESVELEGFALDGSYEEIHFGSFVRGLAGPARRAQPPQDPNQNLWDQQHAVIDITLDMSAATIPSATATLTMTSLSNGLSQCVLDLDDNSGALTVSAVDDGAGTPLAFTHSGAQNRLFVTLASPVNAGNDFTVRVFYSGTPVPSAAYRRTTQSGVPLVYTESQAYRARTWWPCKDLPHDKLTVDLNVTCPDTVYSGFPLSVVCNGSLTGVTPGAGTNTFHWSESHPIATQYVSICCTNYRVDSGTYTALDTVTTMPVTHHIWPNSWASQSGRVNQTVEILDFMADRFGEYPFLTEKYANVVWGRSYGMEHQTNTSINDGSTGLGSDYSRRNVHETGHMWFGTSVGVETFDHLWISEGWATYIEALFYEYQSGSAAYHAYVNAWTTSDAFPIVSSNADSFNLSVVYRKGAWVLHMLRHVIGDSAFFSGAMNYAQDPTLIRGTATTEDLEAHFEAASGRTLDWFFDQWLLRASRPGYEWFWSTYQDSGDAIVQISIEQVQADSVYVMPIDFEVEFSGGATTTVIVTNEMQTQAYSVNVGPGTVVDVRFDPNNWILKNITELTPPVDEPPTLVSVIGDGAAGEMTITWQPSGNLGLAGYRLYRSANGSTGWTQIANEGTLGAGATSHTVTGLSTFETAYFRLTAVTSIESAPSDVYGARLGQADAPLLIVDDVDRWDTQTSINPTGARQNFVAIHGQAVSHFGTPFDSCANEAVGGSVALGDYDVAVWVLADESTVDETFDSSEQALVTAFLEGGGKLFVSGNEIGWDLGRTSRPQADQDFYHDYLAADYVADDSNDYTVDATGPGSIFNGLSITYGDGGDSPYLPDFPDVIAAQGSTAALQYSPGSIASIQYQGPFGAGATDGMLVHLGFAFETIYPESSRNEVMSRVLSWFSAPVPSGLVLFGSE